MYLWFTSIPFHVYQMYDKYLIKHVWDRFGEFKFIDTIGSIEMMVTIGW